MSQETNNWILRALSTDQRDRIMAAAEFVDLPKNRLLYDINKPITDVYFIENGVSSIISVLADNTAVETCTCGREGMVGIPLFSGSGNDGHAGNAADTRKRLAFATRRVSG